MPPPAASCSDASAAEAPPSTHELRTAEEEEVGDGAEDSGVPPKDARLSDKVPQPQTVSPAVATPAGAGVSAARFGHPNLQRSGTAGSSRPMSPAVVEMEAAQTSNSKSIADGIAEGKRRSHKGGGSGNEAVRTSSSAGGTAEASPRRGSVEASPRHLTRGSVGSGGGEGEEERPDGKKFEAAEVSCASRQAASVAEAAGKSANTDQAQDASTAPRLAGPPATEATNHGAHSSSKPPPAPKEVSLSGFESAWRDATS
jgi:hypothetical protein